ncbi:MAG: aldo/keto reductase [Gammaproteobacteria bacterium]|nr:aldo/keto reductase [Gammaproteobacteria bacterium]
MRFRTLGRTGIEVSEFAFGCGKVGGIMIDAEPDIMHTAVQRALASGINWFDTAAQYGDGRSETNLGRIFDELGASPYVSTKFSVDPADTSDIAGQVESRLHESLQRLGLERIELFQLHNMIEATSEGRALSIEDIIRSGGVIDSLERLRDQGLFDWIGITALGDAGLCRDLIAAGRVDTAQVYYNMLNPTAAHMASGPSQAGSGQHFDGLLDACAAANTGVFAIRALAAGVLATDLRHGRESMITKDTALAEEERKTRAVFALFGDRYGTRAQTALRFVLSHPAVSCVDFAVADLAQLDEGLAAAELNGLPGEAFAQLDELFRRDYQDGDGRSGE